ncbi:HAD family hydrolase [Paenibacillus mucilaginosus]|uniref:Predicted hydrolase of the HAD superfamily n=2 Tax=Paenibacillus mucilaginosus TaxID=61624 RepID=F8FHC6_PAEMK|nr:HAD family hydrolase [Paenibacillus mucilaginosus]AEI39828.1 Predicted hydrolase of the HAD superfamily [Paenibacillus mucilaginosus KNP414]AFC28503.1 putative hydrolase of the HAD superfamily [Paenibacillus mucilaginosus 3016]MCG7217864.1 Cof-type HAD-IIB family hydrolase [Paenibacillus mucilaginosus]WDM29108.1 HAD family phosphatase [Paenibacillus mucilaginosus]WFA17294.1 HAD family phosphatase [Paenibacillus mucilaginosus]
MIKLIVSDLDGTMLLHEERQARTEDIDALKEAAAAGIAVAFASGRMHPEIQAVMEIFGMRTHSISQNGAYVHTQDGQLVQSSAFDTGLIKELAGAAAGTSLLTVLAAPESYVVQEWSEAAEALKPRLMAPLVEMPDLLEKLGDELVCGKLSYMGELAELKRLQEKLLARYGEIVDAYISDIDCLDVMPRTTSKGTGLKALLAVLGLTQEEAVCFGDSFNDLPMFAATPHSFAMGSAHPDVQAKAARTVPFVADALKWVRAYNAAGAQHPDAASSV